MPAAHLGRVQLLVEPATGPGSVPLLSSSCWTGWSTLAGPVITTERLGRLPRQAPQALVDVDGR
ncbi:hypothetical protein [Streptomyces chiangmaiensis]|uniref:Uncharacterized protein n=1 Tax=Streptomyces chiangmaiensis TaxID=766497 RepID=A0ABU7FQS1_9ACTN|nr:hypothetical protein [Streptomyces chiangmaiensis]MED7826193.1 hypothetical protein [Streptomyces chiangmaiensis]